MISRADIDQVDNRACFHPECDNDAVKRVARLKLYLLLPRIIENREGEKQAFLSVLDLSLEQVEMKVVHLVLERPCHPNSLVSFRIF